MLNLFVQNSFNGNISNISTANISKWSLGLLQKNLKIIKFYEKSVSFFEYAGSV